MASIIKRCGCPGWDGCPHPWVVRYRTQGGRASRQREQSFGDDLHEAEDFLLKVEHDKKARVFIDPNAGRVTFRAEAEAWLSHHLGADSTIVGYRSVLRWHVYPAIGDRQIRTIRREDIKEIIATMTRKGLSASRVSQAHLVINAVFNETVRNKELAESPCTDIPVPSSSGQRTSSCPMPASWRCWPPGCRRTGAPASGSCTAAGCGSARRSPSGPAAASTRARPCGSGSRSTRSPSSAR